jgi:hypothetical protein
LASPGLNDQALFLPADTRQDLVERIQDVAVFHGWLGAPVNPALPAAETWLIYGTGRDTETHIAFSGNTPQPGVTQDGDGTVPSISALALALAANRQFAVSGIEHSVACRDG